MLVGAVVERVCTWHGRGRVKVMEGSSRALSEVVGEDSLHTFGNVVKGELHKWCLLCGVSCKLAYQMVGKG